ncbi:MAG: ABC transporter ATP-binding protein [Pseudonocardiaceae bacterium]
MPSEVLLAAKDLTAGYGGVPVVHGVDLNARRGDVTVIVGPNGAGKSTLLRALVGEIPVLAGRVVLNGAEVQGLPSNRLVHLGISYVPQVSNIFPSLTVHENLEMGGFPRRNRIRDRISEMCNLFPDLRDALKKTAQNLSGGQRNMLALARGLMSEPSVLIVDEPTAGLSPRYEAAVWEHIVRVKESGVAVLAVEQNTRRALTSADWAYVLVLGRRRLEGTGAELLGNDQMVQMYIGKRRAATGVVAAADSNEAERESEAGTKQ